MERSYRPGGYWLPGLASVESTAALRVSGVRSGGGSDDGREVSRMMITRGSSYGFTGR